MLFCLQAVGSQCSAVGRSSLIAGKTLNHYSCVKISKTLTYFSLVKFSIIFAAQFKYPKGRRFHVDFQSVQ